MSKLDFDFSDISGNQEIAPLAPEKKLKQKKLIKNQTGIVLPIPCDKGYINKDIADCTSEEFVAWAAEVYPEPLPANKFQKVITRLNAFHDILKFHVKPLFPISKEEEKLLH